MSQSTFYILSLLLAAAVGIKPAIVFFRWYNARLRAQGSVETMDGVKDTFVSEIATNHLPHLYSADEKLASGINALLEKMGSEHRIVLDEPPPIRWLPFDPSTKK